MSLNDQQLTCFRFTKTNMPKIAKMIREDHNNRQEFIYNLALDLYKLAIDMKIKTKFDLSEYVLKYSSSYIKPSFNHGNMYSVPYYSEQAELIFEELFSAKNKKLRKPRKSVFKKLTSKDKNFSISLSWMLNLYVDSENQKVVFLTDYNNHASDTIDAKYPDYLIKKLKSHKWGNGEGGFSLYHSENFSCDELDEDNINFEFLTDTWGKLGKKIEKEKADYYGFKAKMAKMNLKR